MNSLSKFLSSRLLDFIPRNSPSKNIERPDEIDILLETLSESDIQLLDRRVTNDLDDNEHQQEQGTPGHYRCQRFQYLLSWHVLRKYH